MKYLWADLKSAELAGMLGNQDIAVILVSSCEQHSKHLPLGTDQIIGEYILHAVAEKTSSPIFILPSIQYGNSKHHLGFPGTVHIQPKTLVSLIEDIIESVIQTGIKNIVIFNSHGGNTASLNFVLNEISLQYAEANIVSLRYWDFIRNEIRDIRESKLGGIGHAGELETSIMLHIASHLVDEEAMKSDFPAYGGNKWHCPDMFASNVITWVKDFRYYSTEGNVGNPKLASKEKGRAIIEALVSNLEEFFSHFFNKIHTQ